MRPPIFLLCLVTTAPALARRAIRWLVLLGVVVCLQAAGARAAAPPGWRWPLPGNPSVDRPFQPPASAWGSGHRGVDLRGSLGDPVLAAGAGRVSYAGLLAGRGVVTVTHGNGLRTTYEPVDPSVSVGASVGLGDALGALETGHGSCRPGTVCLHWGLLRGDTYLDPLALLLGGHVRLLPAADTPAAAGPAAQPAADTASGPRRAARSTQAPRTAHRPPHEVRSPVLTGVANVAGAAAVGYLLVLGVRRLRWIRRRDD